MNSIITIAQQDRTDEIIYSHNLKLQNGKLNLGQKENSVFKKHKDYNIQNYNTFAIKGRNS